MYFQKNIDIYAKSCYSYIKLLRCVLVVEHIR